MGATAVNRLARLSEMGPAELTYRTAERLRQALDRAHFALGAAADRDAALDRRLPRSAARGPFARYLRRAVAERHYPSLAPGAREAMRARCLERAEGGAAAIAAEAERLAAGRVAILGFGEIDRGRSVDWHRDPVTGARWPVRHWTRYDLVGDAVADPKPLLEMARHQHVARLARAAFLLDEERYARAAVAEMLGWIEQNPAGRGVHWHSSLEIALRAIAWMWALGFLVDSPALDPASARRIGASLFAQLEHVRRYPSVYSSPNTHLVGEAAALYLAGLLFVDCPPAAAWRGRGAELLFGEIDRQVGADGVHAELSLGYHAYALDFYLQALALAARQGVHVPARVRERIGRMLDALVQLAAPDGTLPALGDDDGGRALPLEPGSYRSARDLLATGALLFERGDLKRQAGELPETTTWLLGPEADGRYAALPRVVPLASRASFPEGGYFVHRSGWHRDAAHLVFDCGGLGRMGGGHGHADALALTLTAYGAELLVDSGTFVYGGAPELRDRFRSTAAHNTVRLDGREQSEPSGTFRWARAATARLLADQSFDGFDYLAGEHDGYLAPPVGVVHRRRILFARPDYWLVIDDFRGRGEHDFELFWHLAPEAVVERAEGASESGALRVEARHGGARLEISMQARVPLGLEVDPAGSSVSRRYGERRAAPLVAVRGRALVPFAILTVLAPSSASVRRDAARWRAEPLPIAGDARPDVLAAALRSGDREDLVLFSASGDEIETAACRGRGELFWARLEGDRLQRLVAIGARDLHLHTGTTAASGRGPARPAAPAWAPRRFAIPEDETDVRHRRNL